ncbi:MAG: DUF3579 domain-containing protein [Gammaproteobacteria bacterium]|nr:DUF3579 domain-containing protein [Gammaproteobacteria bacterium]
MSKQLKQLVIESIREDGGKFRPSDWAERISTTLAEFGADHRLHYAEGVRPIMRDGIKCLIVDRALESENPVAFNYILDFVKENGLRMSEEVSEGR